MKEFIVRFFLCDDTIVEYIVKAQNILTAEKTAERKYYNFYDTKVRYMTSEEA